MIRIPRRLPTLLAALGLSAVAALGCGATVRRPLVQSPAEVIGEDLCGMQRYFDDIAAGKGAAPAVVHQSDITGPTRDQPSGGKMTFAFADGFQLNELHRVLQENWGGLPPALLSAPRVQLEVNWSQKAGVRRVVTTENAEISDGQATTALPYHICLSELLFGAPLYQTRRAMLGLPAPTPAPAASLTAGSAGTLPPGHP